MFFFLFERLLPFDGSGHIQTMVNKITPSFYNGTTPSCIHCSFIIIAMKLCNTRGGGSGGTFAATGPDDKN